MSKRSSRLAASILFLALTFLLFAETNNSLPYYIQWDSVQGAGGYTVEVRTPKGDTVYTEQFDSSAKDAELDLTAGKYQFRIVTLNKLLKADNATDWVAFEVLSMTAPVFVRLTPATLTTGKPVALTLTADRLTLTAKAKLVSPSGREIPLAIKKIKNDTFTLTAPALAERGTYSFVLVNSADFTTRKNNFVTVNYPDFTVTSTSLSSSILTVKGKNFSKETVLYLAQTSRSATRNKIPLASMTDTLLTAKLPVDLPAGDYGIFLANASDLPVKSIYAFTISPPVVAEAEPVPEETPSAISVAPPSAVPPAIEPPYVAPIPAPVENPPTATAGAPAIEPVPTTATETAITPPAEPVQTKAKPALKPVRHRIALGGGVKTDCLFGGWADVYPGFRFSGYGFSDFYITNNLRPTKGMAFDFSLGLRADFASMTNDGSGKFVKSFAQDISGLLCPAFTVSLPWIRARLYLAAGCEYVSVSAKNMYGTETIRAANIDPAGGAGVSIEYPVTDYFMLGIANQLLYIQDAKGILKYTASGFIAMMIPVR